MKSSGFCEERCQRGRGGRGGEKITSMGLLRSPVIILETVLCVDVSSFSIKPASSGRAPSSRGSAVKGRGETPITGDHSKWDQILSVKIAKYVSLCVDLRFFLIWSPVIGAIFL